MKEFCSTARPFPRTRRSSYRSRGTMDRYLRFVLLFAVLPFAMQEAVENGGCECAVFPMQISEPIIERALQYNVTCSGEGEEKCQQLCIALAESAKDRAPQMICEKLNVHVENLQVAVYAKICKATTWKFTGLQSADPICCHEGNPTPCGEPTAIIEN